MNKVTYFSTNPPFELILNRISEIYCEFYDKYYNRKHLVTTCQLGHCAQLES